jgi:small-conductance mechanosensitive channel
MTDVSVKNPLLNNGDSQWCSPHTVTFTTGRRGSRILGAAHAPAAGRGGTAVADTGSMRTFFARVLLVAVLTTIHASAAAQTGPTDSAGSEAAAAAAAVAQSVPGEPASLTYANREIVQLRASVLGRPPSERAAAGRLTLDSLVEAGVNGPVTARQIGEVASLEVGGRRVVAILPSDVNALAGETPATVGAAAARRLEIALNELAELKRPWELLAAVGQLVLATTLFVAIVWMLTKARVAASRRIAEAAERSLQATQIGKSDFVRSSRIIDLLHRVVRVVAWILGLFFAYSWLTFGLRRFPYTRPWGESLREFLLGQLAGMGMAILQALPGLFTVLMIVLITRFVIRLIQLLFQSIEDGRITLPWVYPETAQPTRKLLTVGLWLFAVAIAYPYLPGSDSEAFKGMSVFVGLVLSLGSSGIVNQVMSGFTLTYSRALRVGDFVQAGDIEGTVSQVGTLSTKIKTAKGEDVTIPNSLMVSQTVTNYSRFADVEGVFVPTDITIGYDVPWRQVEALLLLAATRTPGVRREPAPVVRQASLEDAYVRYTLQFCLENPAQRRKTLAVVHTNILDAFNEYGVQITSPNYEADPERPKIVPRDQWFAAPAIPAAPRVEADLRTRRDESVEA